VWQFGSSIAGGDEQRWRGGDVFSVLLDFNSGQVLDEMVVVVVVTVTTTTNDD
jgi:hypothetical protein